MAFRLDPRGIVTMIEIRLFQTERITLAMTQGCESESV